MANYIDCKRIDILELYQAKMFQEKKQLIMQWRGFLTPLNREKENTVIIESSGGQNKQIVFGYIWIDKDENSEKLIYSIKLTRIGANLGGSRYFFTCPLVKNGVVCGRRVSVLYKPDNEKYFGCRHCHEIKYPTQTYNRRSNYFMDAMRSIIENRIDNLEGKISRQSFGGKSTKKQTRLELLYKEAKKYPSFYYDGAK